MIVSVGRMMRKGGGGLIWPTGMKEHIKAWYDPKKQGMTNYDVIESYAEDFTNWIFRNNVADATIANNKLIITETKAQNDRFIYSTNANEDLILYITGIDTVGVCYYNGSSTLALHNGLNKIHTNKGYIDIRSCRGIGACNITITQLPTSILKDLSGNGNHAYLYGGKGKLNSGMGLYKVDFTSWRKSSVQTEVKPDVVKVTPNTSNYLFIQYANSVEIPSYKIKVVGLGDNVLKYQYATENGRKEINIVEGENELPTSIKVSKDYQIGYRLTPGTSVFTITQIPDYPDQLCYDGKMYAVCYGFPILTDYTVMADRTWFDKTGVKYFLSKYKENESVPAQLFKFEWIVNGKEYSTSLGRDVEVVFPNGITWQTKTSYNGKGLPNSTYEDGDLLLIGKVWLNSINYFIGCHGAIIVADRSFTEEEINWLKDNLFRK